MISIYVTTEVQAQLIKLMEQREGLNELVQLIPIREEEPLMEWDAHALKADREGLHVLLDWWDLRPPLLLPDPLPLTSSNILGLACFLLGDYENAYGHFQSSPTLQRTIGFMYQLAEGMAMDLQDWHTSSSPAYYQLHNTAILYHYGHHSHKLEFETLAQLFQQALNLAPNQQLKAFSLKYYATFLIDIGQYSVAQALLREQLTSALPHSAQISLKQLLATTMKEQLGPSADPALVSELKTLIWEVKQYYEGKAFAIQTAMSWLEASFVAQYEESFAEALGYVNTAIPLLKQEEVPLLLGNAFMQKAQLLQQWAGQENPQFYAKAIESYQQALKIFKRETHPHIFADIHHQLAMIYIEMPAPAPKKAMLASISVSSFEEALQYFTQEAHPYEFGMICNNYGNSYTKYPTAYGVDNYEKAIHLLKAALSVRSAEQYPTERTVSLLNLLEAYWNYPDEKNAGTSFNEERYKEMLRLAEEAHALAPSHTDLAASASDQLERLTLLAKSIYA